MSIGLLFLAHHGIVIMLFALWDPKERMCLTQHVLQEMRLAVHDNGTPVFEPDMIQKSEKRALDGCLWHVVSGLVSSGEFDVCYI